MSKSLVLVDIQNDYFPGGAMELTAMEAAAERASAVLERCRAQGWPVFHIQHLSIRPGATFFLPDTRGAEHHTSVAPRAGETVVRKHFPNSFRDTTLQAALEHAGNRELVIVGAMSHMCIDATTRAAFDLGYGCTVLADACATRDLSFGETRVPAAQVHASFMAALSSPYAQVLMTDAWLSA